MRRYSRSLGSVGTHSNKGLLMSAEADRGLR